MAPVIGNNSRCGVGMDVAREGSEGRMSGNFESLPYERFSAVMTILPTPNKIESDPESGLGRR